MGLVTRGLLLALPFIVQCASYSSRVREPRSLFDRGEYDRASSELEKLAERKDNDELLYLLDLGLVYHTSGQYQKAINTLLKAKEIAEISDYTSLTEEAGSVILSDDVKAYKGEHFEKILIHVYLAIDYALLRKWEEALVECRQVNHKLDLMISKGGLPYERNAFAKYLAASLFEARGELNDAFVDYRETLKWKEEPELLGVPLLRISDKLQFSQEYQEFKRKFPDIKKYIFKKGEGEILLLLEQGKSPVKSPSEVFRLVPVFKKQFYSSDFAWISVGRERARSFSLFDIEQTAIKELDHRLGLIIAKKVGGVVVKEIIADQVAKRTNNELLGNLTRLALWATDSADLRSWTTLPARLQIARLTVPSGRHRVVLDMVNRMGGENKGVKVFDDVEVRPGETIFLNYRATD